MSIISPQSPHFDVDPLTSESSLDAKAAVTPRARHGIRGICDYG